MVTPQTSPQRADPHGLGAFLKRTTQEIHVDRRVVGWSAGRHVDHPCGEQISPWPARKVTDYNICHPSEYLIEWAILRSHAGTHVLRQSHNSRRWSTGITRTINPNMISNDQDQRSTRVIHHPTHKQFRNIPVLEYVMPMQSTHNSHHEQVQSEVCFKGRGANTEESCSEFQIKLCDATQTNRLPTPIV